MEKDTKPALFWQAHEYDHYERSVDWFWAVGIVTLAFVVIALIFGNGLFALVVILGTFALVMQTVRKPRRIDFSVNDRGITVDGKLYTYSMLRSFWVTEQKLPNERAKLIIKPQKTLAPFIIIPLSDEIDPDDVREVLLRYVYEEELVEPFSEKLMEYLGF